VAKAFSPACEFVKCTLLIDHGTEQLAFTECVFKDCNIDELQRDEDRGLYRKGQFFRSPARGKARQLREEVS
jgi:hypothetical protein